MQLLYRQVVLRCLFFDNVPKELPSQVSSLLRKNILVCWEQLFSNSQPSVNQVTFLHRQFKTCIRIGLNPSELLTEVLPKQSPLAALALPTVSRNSNTECLSIFHSAYGGPMGFFLRMGESANFTCSWLNVALGFFLNYIKLLACDCN